MAYKFKKVLNHGAPTPIVARLSLQILEILKQCNASKNIHDAIGNLYVNSLLPRLIRCWEIEERFKQEFVAAIDSYKPSASANAGVEVPQIARLEPECHNFLYEAKNFIRDLLQVVNHLYGTTFEEASEFSRAAKKKGSQSQAVEPRQPCRPCCERHLDYCLHGQCRRRRLDRSNVTRGLHRHALLTMCQFSFCTLPRSSGVMIPDVPLCPPIITYRCWNFLWSKMARSAPRSPFGLPEATAVVRAASLSCQNEGKAPKFSRNRESSGEPRLRPR